MQIIDHGTQAREQWRQGVMTRMLVSAEIGGQQLCIFDQWCDPDLGAPTHLHAVEEVLTVIEGQAEVWVEQETRVVSNDQSVLIPAGYKHGFRNCGDCVLHVRATLASPIFEAAYDDQRETPRRWLPNLTAEQQPTEKIRQ